MRQDQLKWVCSTCCSPQCIFSCIAWSPWESGGMGRSGVLAPTSSPCPGSEKGLFVPHLGLWQWRDNECSLWEDGKGGQRCRQRGRWIVMEEEGAMGSLLCHLLESVPRNAYWSSLNCLYISVQWHRQHWVVLSHLRKCIYIQYSLH